jgi:hypothetical protein
VCTVGGITSRLYLETYFLDKMNKSHPLGRLLRGASRSLRRRAFSILKSRYEQRTRWLFLEERATQHVCFRRELNRKCCRSRTGACIPQGAPHVQASHRAACPQDLIVRPQNNFRNRRKTQPRKAGSSCQSLRVQEKRALSSRGKCGTPVPDGAPVSSRETSGSTGKSVQQAPARQVRSRQVKIR